MSAFTGLGLLGVQHTDEQPAVALDAVFFAGDLPQAVNWQASASKAHSQDAVSPGFPIDCQRYLVVAAQAAGATAAAVVLRCGLVGVNSRLGCCWPSS